MFLTGGPHFFSKKFLLASFSGVYPPEALSVEPGLAREPRGEPAGVLVLAGAGDLVWTHRPRLKAQRLVVRTLCGRPSYKRE